MREISSTQRIMLRFLKQAVEDSLIHLLADKRFRHLLAVDVLGEISGCIRLFVGAQLTETSLPRLRDTDINIEERQTSENNESHLDRD